MLSILLLVSALLVPKLVVADDTGLLQASLAASANSSYLDLVQFHTEATHDGHAVQKPMREILELVGAYARNISDAGKRPAFVHIGANRFDNSVRWADMHLYGEVQRALSLAGVPLHAYSMHLVEPRNSTHDALRAKLNRLGLTEERDSEIIHALIMGNCPGPTMTMYGPSEYLRKCPCYDTIDSWSSLDPKHFAIVVNGLRKERWQDWHFIKYAHPIWAADATVATEPDESKWVEERPVKCSSSMELLASMAADARDVAMLVVDAEGADFGIVSEFLKLDTFAPALIQFEGRYNSMNDYVTPKGDSLLEALRSRGYGVGTLMTEFGFTGTDADNLYAVRM